MESYFLTNLKRKDLDEVNDDLCDFSFSSPARKIRRLDAELPPISEEETVNPVAFRPSQDTFVEQVVRSSPISIDELSGSLPANEERAIVLYDPINNMPSLQSRSPFSISVNSEFLVGFKNLILGSHLLKSLDSKTEKWDDNGSLAVVPCVRTHSRHQENPEMRIPHSEVSEMMDADDLEATTMEIEDNSSQLIPVNGFGSVNQWQQHCMIPQLPQNLSTPITWPG